MSKQNVNALIMNWLVTEGYVEAARTFEEETGTATGVQDLMPTITDRMNVRQAVQNGQVEEAIERVNVLNPEILGTQGELLFHLQQQRLIELIRAGKTQEALEFAAEVLAPAGEQNPALLQELERTVALLAFTDPQASPVGNLLGLAQRQKTASELNAAILRSQSQEPEARLPKLLRLLQWAQSQLAERATFPLIVDLATAQTTDSS